MVVALPRHVHGQSDGVVTIPVVDLSCRSSDLPRLIAGACEKTGCFMVINHGVPADVTLRMEEAAREFFALPAPEKRLAGPPSPCGYGSRAIGPNGDVGELEYLLLHANPSSISQRARTLSASHDPIQVSCAVKEYVTVVSALACEILELLAEGLGLPDAGVFSRLIRNRESDSLLRLNHYPPFYCNDDDNVEEEEHRNGAGHSKDGACCNTTSSNSKSSKSRIGFGEHTDPQIITLLRSNSTPGLQVLWHTPSSSTDEGLWVPMPPNPAGFCVIVGDTLQAMTNGRLTSVRHRAVTNCYSSRLSMVYFGSPPPSARISPLPEMISPETPRRYKSFTWDEYKRKMYSHKLGYNRLDLFKIEPVVQEKSRLIKGYL